MHEIPFADGDHVTDELMHSLLHIIILNIVMSCRNQDKKLIFVWRSIRPFQCQDPCVSSLQTFSYDALCCYSSLTHHFLQESDTETANTSRGIREGRARRG
jgi:hypothetical protein